MKNEKWNCVVRKVVHLSYRQRLEESRRPGEAPRSCSAKGSSGCCFSSVKWGLGGCPGSTSLFPLLLAGRFGALAELPERAWARFVYQPSAFQESGGGLVKVGKGIPPVAERLRALK